MKKGWLISCVISSILSLLSQANAQIEKIGPDLREEMIQREPDELIPIIINLSPQPDIESIKRVAQEMGKPKRRAYVTTQLKNLATESQQDVLTQLRNREGENKARNIKSIWLANVIAVEIENQLINAITNIDAVNYIFLDHESFDLQDVAWHVQKVRADDVWQSFGCTGDGILVSVHDSGINYDHSDLHSNIWNNPGEDYDEDGHTLEFDGQDWILDPGDINGEDDDGNGYVDDLIGWDFSESIPDNDPWFDDDHGTHVAGIIAGDGTAGTQTGVAPNAKLMCLKVLKNGRGLSSNYWLSVQYALDNGADIANFSIGKIMGGGINGTTIQERATFRQVFEATVAAGLTVCAAAGTDELAQPPNGIRIPANIPPVIAVGGTDIDDNIASWSAPGPVEWYGICKPTDEWGDSVCYNDYPYPPGLLKPDVSAPGANITSTWIYDNYYTQMSGTSMAAPVVSGAAALLLEAHPDFTPEIVKYILEKSSVDLGPAGKDSLYGSGRIDAYKAIESIKSGTITSNETWSSWALVIGDVTVPSGVTLTIDPGTRVEFVPTDNQNSGEDPARCELIVYGDLIADGTSSDGISFTSSASSPAKADWYGLVLCDSSSILDHCTMNYADKGLHCYKCSLEVSNLDISECNYGAYVETTGTKLYLDSTSIYNCSKAIHINKGALRLTDCQLNDNSVGLECHNFHVFYKVVPPIYYRPYPDFEDCEFNNNTQEGILLYDSSPRINDCDVSGNGLWGMKCHDDSDPTLGYVTLADNGCGGKEEGPPPSSLTSGGLYTTGTSCPLVCDGAVEGSYYRGYNTITGNCSTGVSCHGSSSPKLGKGLFSKGENSIYNNTEWEIYNETGSTVYAEYNWWNDEDGPALDKLHGLIDAQPWLVEPPSKSGKRRIVDFFGEHRGFGPSTPGEYNELGTNYLLQLQYDQAIEAFEYVLNNFPDTPEANYALVHLMHCYREGGYGADIGPYLNNITLNSQNEELKSLAHYMTISQLCREAQYESALSTITTLLATDCDEEMQRSVKFRKGMIYIYDLDNKPSAIGAFQDFIAEYPDDHRAPLAQLELDILGADQTRRIRPQEKIVISGASLPEDYVLHPNYPNPFNAQTCIEYKMPRAAEVFLSVYNVLGQRVIVLENDLMPAGRHQVIWDGRDRNGLEVASGIYFARLQAGEFTFTKKMVLIR